jgi:hypothetical protein
VGAPEHRVGERPTLRLVVVNVSDQPCVRDLDGARQEIVVWSGDGAQRLWSSNDCVNPETVDVRTLVPGQPVAFAVRWAGRTSVPGCAERRTVVAAGRVPRDDQDRRPDQRADAVPAQSRLPEHRQHRAQVADLGDPHAGRRPARVGRHEGRG